MAVEKPKPKQLPRPITRGADSAMNQSQFLAITCNSLKAREKSRVQGAIAFGFASHWLKNWRESLKPITKRRNRNHVITFDSHLKTALTHRYRLSPFKLDFILKNHSYIRVPLNFVIATKTSGEDFFITAIAPCQIDYTSHFLASVTYI